MKNQIRLHLEGERYGKLVVMEEAEPNSERSKTPLHFTTTLLTVRIFLLRYNKCLHCICTRNIAIIYTLSHAKHRYDLR